MPEDVGGGGFTVAPGDPVHPIAEQVDAQSATPVVESDNAVTAIRCEPCLGSRQRTDHPECLTESQLGVFLENRGTQWCLDPWHGLGGVGGAPRRVRERPEIGHTYCPPV